MIHFHPSAVIAYNKQALSLIGLVANYTHIPQPSKKLKDIIAPEINHSNINGTITLEITDESNLTIGRFFHNNPNLGIIDDSYKQLSNLATIIKKQPSVREKLSLNFIECIIFQWIEYTYYKKEPHSNFTDFFLSKAINAIENLSVLVPISDTIIEDPFYFCGHQLCNVPASIFIKRDDLISKLTDDKLRFNIERKVYDLKKKIQGFAAIRIKIECEKNYAVMHCFEIASQITALINTYSPAITHPNLKSLSKIKGTEYIEKYMAIFEHDTDFSQVSKLLNSHTNYAWLITKQEYSILQSKGLNTISTIFTMQKKTEFHKTILNMSFLYSKAAFTADPMEKIIYVLSALESTLLRTSTEPIQQNLSDRIVLFTLSQVNERKEAIALIKYIYDLRSKYLHHGNSSNEIKEIRSFLLLIHSFYQKLISCSNEFKTKQEFLEHIDNIKYSGNP